VADIGHDMAGSLDEFTMQMRWLRLNRNARKMESKMTRSNGVQHFVQASRELNFVARWRNILIAFYWPATAD